MDFADRGIPRADAASDDAEDQQLDGIVPSGLRRRPPALASTRIEEWLVGQPKNEGQANGSPAPEAPVAGTARLPTRYPRGTQSVGWRAPRAR